MNPTQLLLARVLAQGWRHLPGTTVAPGGLAADRGLAAVILEDRFLESVRRINAHLPIDAAGDILAAVVRMTSRSFVEKNVDFTRWARSGVPMLLAGGAEGRGEHARLFAPEAVEENDWLVVSNLTLMVGDTSVCADLVFFVNGMPLVVVAVASEGGPVPGLIGAFHRLQDLKSHAPALFATNLALLVSDGATTRVGSLTAGLERYGPWNEVEDFFERRATLDFLVHFTFWETKQGFVKKIAGRHQVRAVNKAVAAALRATSVQGDGRIGVLWHTQGSGKSTTMLYLAGKLIVEPALNNPTLVVISDRNDLDDQLYAQFCAAKDVLPPPKQARSREHLRSLLQAAAGGVYFTTMQKLSLASPERDAGLAFPLLCARRNVVVLVDEAHRTQYGFRTRYDTETGQVHAGFAQNLRNALPNASFVAFTGTPIEEDDRSTSAVFGSYLDTYGITQSIADGATVPLYYENRVAKIAEPSFEWSAAGTIEAVAEVDEDRQGSEVQSTWRRLESTLGSPRRLQRLARDLVAHWERRRNVMHGKAMVVCMSRRICVQLYDEIVRLRPSWHGGEDGFGAVKVVITGTASDPETLQPHLRSKERRKLIERRFKDAEDPLEIVLVRDMWLTGFDVPSAHTIYLYKPMQRHGLLQAVARVNRPSSGKPSGLAVDYLGLGDQFGKAVASYAGLPTEAPGAPVENALAVLQEKFEIVQSLLHGFDYQGFRSRSKSQRLAAMAGAVNWICGLNPRDIDAGKRRFTLAVASLNRAACAALHLDAARHLRDEVGFFQALQGLIEERTVPRTHGGDARLSVSFREILSRGLAVEGPTEVFGQAGVLPAGIERWSDEVLTSLQRPEHAAFRLDLLRKLLAGGIESIRRANIVAARDYTDRIAKALGGYQSGALDMPAVMAALTEIAVQMRDEAGRGAALALTGDELALYDALSPGDRDRQEDEQPRASLARELAALVRGAAGIDWTLKEATRADLRRQIKRLLRAHGYPAAQIESATGLMLEQAAHRFKGRAGSAA